MTESAPPDVAPPPLPPAAAAQRDTRTGRYWRRLTAALDRHPWLLPALSFAFGVGSFLLVQRGEHLARVMAAIALLGWPWLLAEGVLGRWIARRSRGRLPEATARFITQQVQQELLFFSLPFLFAATQPVPGQIVFTALAAALALASVIDPLWWHRIAPNDALSIGFHAGCTFVAALAILPIAVHLPLDRVLAIAYGLTAATCVIALPRLLRSERDNAIAATPAQIPTLMPMPMPMSPPSASAPASSSITRPLLRVALLGLVLGLGWLGRAAIPPAGLWVREARITTTISDDRTPGQALSTIDAAALPDGLVAFVAVRAPRGLSQRVLFEWRHDGKVVDRIPAEIGGGRDAGFRTWSRKQNFGSTPAGRWQVDLRTPEGQLIARRRFTVR